MTRYLIDTNHLSDAVRRVSRVRDQIQRRSRAGDRFGTCGPALCELEAGMQQAARPADMRRRLTTLLGVVRLWLIDESVAKMYGALFLDLQRKGRTLSQVDLMLGALARHDDLTLLTTDRDFEALPAIRTENWLI
jgi:tRNA(fMet)-specific endonuclease VapC